MKNCKLLSIDESGKASYNHPSDLFTLSGVVIPEEYKVKVDRQIRKLKKKFFKDEEIVFHSRDMTRRKGPFHILRDPKLETAFWSEYISILNNPAIGVIFIITNKSKAKSKAWQQKTILERSYKRILEYFVKGLKKGFQGKIITESDPSQDLLLIKAHNHLQSVGTSDKKITAQEYRNTITSLSLVNKRNQDADVQIADSLALVGSMMHRMLPKVALSEAKPDAETDVWILIYPGMSNSPTTPFLIMFSRTVFFIYACLMLLFMAKPRLTWWTTDSFFQTLL